MQQVREKPFMINGIKSQIHCLYQPVMPYKKIRSAALVQRIFPFSVIFRTISGAKRKICVDSMQNLC